MAEARQYCMRCFALFGADAARCPACGAEAARFTAQAYGEKLLAALGHPLAEVRMRAIIAIGLRSDTEMAAALVACALRHPADIVQGLEIVRSLSRLDSGRAALRQLAGAHPAHAVRAAAQEAAASCAAEHP